MTLLYFIATILVVAGVVMFLFARPMGIGFCRFGKWSFRSAPWPIAGLVQPMVDHVYDESRAPGIFRMLGAVNVIQSIAGLVIAMLI